MYQRPQNRDDQAFRRPTEQRVPDWMQEPMPEDQPPYMEQPEDQPPYDDPAYDAPPYDEQDPGYADDAWQTDRRGNPFEEPPVEEIIATNRTVCLTCTLASMMGLLALFLCFAEKRSRAIRSFSVQSAGLMFLHVMGGAVLLLVGSLLGMIPILGFLINLICWLCYIALLIVTIFLRVRMMLAAWRGVKFILPLVGHRLEHFC